MLRAPCMKCEYRRGRDCPYQIVTECEKYQEFEKLKDKFYYSDAKVCADHYSAELILAKRAGKRK